MNTETSRRPPPSRPFLNLLCFPCTCLCAVSCERLLACPPLLSAYFLTPATGAVKPASHSHSARGPCRSTVGCLHLDPCPWSAPMHVAGAMRHPLSSSHALQHAGTPACSVILAPAPSRARSHEESRGITGHGGQSLAERPPERLPALMPCDSPLLRTTALRPRLESCDSITDLYASLIPGSARTRHRFGDESGTVVIS
jgi:hypothetical protein